MTKSVFAEISCVARLANSFVSRLSIAATGEIFTGAGVLIPLQLLRSKLTSRGRSAVGYLSMEGEGGSRLDIDCGSATTSVTTQNTF